ncbi:mechanosensitive ion channel family protein [Paludibacterium yongneupense]|uniref:mechanosensitive ion channel family protein n=1 Tax=Paludibacterium yongneupense TaxID=400061 RepID=UPI0003F7FDB3|nr:mechanosensitive ion channel domain-containing protein [Paludibacterium yongneupense]
MIYYKRTEISMDALADALQTASGLVELALGGLCMLAGWYVARRLFFLLFTRHPGRYERFLPYAGFRMVMPLTALLVSILCTLLWLDVTHHRPHVLPAVSASLFWLGLIRLLAAIVRQALPSGRFERHTERLMASALWLAFVAWLTGLDDVALDWMQSVSFRVGKEKLDLLMIINGLLWVSGIMVVALWVSREIESWLMRLSHLDLNLRIVFSKLSRSLLLLLAVLIALPIVGIDLTVLSVFGGALGVGLGFGLQKIASNYVSGFIILLDRSIRIGDRLMVENRVGYVSKITSRYVVLKGLDGTEALVPNEVMIANTVINQSYTDKTMWISLPIQVAYGTDLDLALGLLVQAARHARVHEEPPPCGFVTQFGDNGITLEVGLWVRDPENGFMGLKSDINRAIWRLFSEHGIEVPYPQREVMLRNPEVLRVQPAPDSRG